MSMEIAHFVKKICYEAHLHAFIIAILLPEKNLFTCKFLAPENWAR
jgi:hypothetical protein